MYEDAKLRLPEWCGSFLICLGRKFTQERFEKPTFFYNNLIPFFSGILQSVGILYFGDLNMT